MNRYKYKDRDEYFEQQIARSREKSGYCKVFFADILRYRLLLLHAAGSTKNFAPVLCLGVRSGAEVDLFRAVFFGPLLRLKLVQQLATRWDSTTSGAKKIRLARMLGLGSGRLQDGKVVGVEIAPEAKRADIWIGSYDQLPAEWSGRFKVIYSNSIDHSQDPEKTVAEWKRVAAPGAYVILAFTPGQKVTSHDPFGGFGFEEMKNLWKAPVVFSNKTDNVVGYSEICFRLKK